MMHNVVTFADSNYFSYLNCLVTSLDRNIEHKSIFIYDWGISDEQKLWLKRFDFLTLIPWSRTKETFQKVLCTADFYAKYGVGERRNFIVVDADTFFLQDCSNVFNFDFHCGVTHRGVDGVPLNVGVIFFKGEGTDLGPLLGEWVDMARHLYETRKKPLFCDQDSLSRLCGPMTIVRTQPRVGRAALVTEPKEIQLQGAAYKFIGLNGFIYNNWKIPAYGWSYLDIISDDGAFRINNDHFRGDLRLADIRILHFKDDEPEDLNLFPFNVAPVQLSPAKRLQKVIKRRTKASLRKLLGKRAWLRIANWLGRVPESDWLERRH